MRLDIYNLDNELITSYNDSFWYMFILSLSNISITTDIEQQQLYIIFSFLVEWWEDGPGVNSGGKKSCGTPLTFDGNTLNMLGKFLFHNYQRYSNISLFYYYWWYEETKEEREHGGYQGISEISLYPDLVEIDTLGCWDYHDYLTPKFIGSDDDTYNNYGFVYMQNDTFTCLAPITHEVSWFSDYSHLGSSWDIATSANATFNGEDKYLIYFEDDKCEIRDRTNGDIIHFEPCNITPYRLLRNQDGEIIIATQEETLCQIYKITSINFQVSISNYVVSIPQDKIINYPNPFNPETTIEYQLPEDSEVELIIYNIKGQKVKTLVDKQLQQGEHSAIWDCRDSNGKRVSSGIYFYKLQTESCTETKKMLLLK